MLEISNIEVIYNDVNMVLKGISLKVPEHSVVALLGVNGAGKSTTLKAITGMLPNEDGKLGKGMIEFEKIRLDTLDPDRIVEQGLSIVPEGRRVFNNLTVTENLRIGAHIRKDKDEITADIETIFDYFPILKTRSSQLAIYLSGGEQQMLVIGRSLMCRPRLMMLDEPSLGLAPLVVREIFRILKRINEERRTSMLLVEQNAKIALKFASYGYIMENGKIVLDGPSDVLAENEDVKEFYLGVTDESSQKNYAEIKHYKRRKRWLS